MQRRLGSLLLLWAMVAIAVPARAQDHTYNQPTYRDVRASYFSGKTALPASTSVGVPALAQAGFLIEVEAIAVGLTAPPRRVWDQRLYRNFGISFGWVGPVRSDHHSAERESQNVAVAYANDRRHEAGGFVAGNASHLHRRGSQTGSALSALTGSTVRGGGARLYPQLA